MVDRSPVQSQVLNQLCVSLWPTLTPCKIQLVNATTLLDRILPCPVVFVFIFWFYTYFIEL